MRILVIGLVLIGTLTVFCLAQPAAQLDDPFSQGGRIQQEYRPRGGRGRGGGGGGRFRSSDLDFTIPSNRNGVPTWELETGFEGDVFTFVRIITNGGSPYTDYPDSDLNFSYRLQQLTSLKVNPNPITLRLSDPELFRYPFIYFCEPGRGGGPQFTEEEVKAFRRYLDNGGFAMFDDFWGPYEYDALYRNLKKVFPEREPQDLTLDHEVFHMVYDLKEYPQVPSIGVAMSGRQSEAGRDPGVYKGIFDDKGRMMVIICHNTDLGDGWEREGENEWYFHEYSEKRAYPMGINIIFYMMTH